MIWSGSKKRFFFKKIPMWFFLSFQIYVPLTLIVCCSWVTFWLMKTDRGTEIPARTSLGATTVLSVVTIGFGGKSKPQVTKKIVVYLSFFFCLISKNQFRSFIVVVMHKRMGYRQQNKSFTKKKIHFSGWISHCVRRIHHHMFRDSICGPCRIRHFEFFWYTRP